MPEALSPDVFSSGDVTVPVEQIHEVLRRVELTDGVASFSEQFVRELDERRGNATVYVLSTQGRVIAAAVVMEDGNTEVVLDPQFSDDAATLTEALIAPHSGGLKLWAHGDIGPVRTLAQEKGLEPSRTLVVMSLPGAAAVELPSPEFPEGGYELLNLEQSVQRYGRDVIMKQWLDVNNQAFSWHPEQGGWDEQQLEQAMDTEWFNPDDVLMLWQDATLVGFHWLKRHSDQRAEVYVVGMADVARGKGLGTPLLTAGIAHMVGGDPMVETILYVEQDNKAAVKAYENLGFEVIERHVVYPYQSV